MLYAKKIPGLVKNLLSICISMDYFHCKLFIYGTILLNLYSNILLIKSLVRLRIKAFCARKCKIQTHNQATVIYHSKLA